MTNPGLYAPGVRITEGPVGGRPGSGTGVSVAAFIGRLSEAVAGLTLVHSWSEFQTLYPQTSTPSGPARWFPLAVRGFFANGGRACYIAPISGDYLEQVEEHLDALAAEEVGMIVVPDLFDPELGLDEEGQTSVRTAVAEHCSGLGNRMAILDTPKALIPGAAQGFAEQVAEELDDSAPFATLYYPWLTVPGLTAGTTEEIPPCGHIAGAWARNDALRGVHKAPANLTLLEVLGLAWDLIDDEHAPLHVAGVDCVRLLPGKGRTIWGARTLSSDPHWWQINVRRVVNAITEDIRATTRWVTARQELHTQELRGIVTNDVTAVLMDWWRRGALKGTKPSEAFKVTCDVSNNPSPLDFDTLHVDVEVAPVHPAEFITIRVSQIRTQN
ncbi:phage tail sheath family protein [Streptomyces goshikiensis]|uniref:phage tail sheath family protein n=1 Tax=Streptomyces goshikiensis TaxID=1942 RepID=UPI0036BB3AB8